MKKVLIISGALDRGGVERIVIDTAIALKKKNKYQPIVCYLSGSGELTTELSGAGIEFYGLNNEKLGKNIVGTVLRLRKLIKQCEPNIIHTHQLASDFYASMGSVGLNIPIVSHIHNPRGTRFRENVRRILNKYFIDAFIASIEEKAEELISVLPQKRGRVFILHNAVNTKKFSMQKTFNKNDSKKTLGFPERSIVIGAFGRFVHEKGYDILLGAFETVSKQIEDSYLLLVGDGPEMSELKRMAQQLKIETRVKFLGHRNNIVQLISTTDIVVISSRIESFSLVAIEAMSLGIPVIISNTLSSKEIFSSATIISELSPEALSKNIVSLLRDYNKMEELKNKGKKLVAERFTIEHYVKELEEIYNKILNDI